MRPSTADDPVELRARALHLQETVRRAGVPGALRTALVDAYHRLGDDVAVAVRSSATAEDAAGTSFAGMHSTFTDVAGPDDLIRRLLDCWVSLYGERVISYRAGAVPHRRTLDRRGRAAACAIRTRRRHVQRRSIHR